MPASLYEALSRLNKLPMHMPGHKRNTALAPYLSGLGADKDITEIFGMDNLAAPQGILREGMDLAARLYGAHRSFYLVNGSTAGILAGIRALTSPGDRVIIPRHSHMSVHNAIALNALHPFYLMPPLVEGFGIPGSMDPQLLQDAVRRAPDARLLVITCPEYQGQIHDLAALVAIAHEAKIKVLIDAAHGAHLGFSPLFPQGAVSSGADVVVHSLHKTLPSLTQTALAHANSEDTAARLEEQLRIFQTSSPSYLLMASIDGCLRLIDERGPALFSAWRDGLDAFHERIQGLQHLRVLGLGSVKGLYALDPSKILISAAGTSVSGYDLMDKLRDGYEIELEMAGPYDALAMSGMGDGREDLERLAEALLGVDKGLSAATCPDLAPLPAPERALPAHQALSRSWHLVPYAEAKGQVAAEYALIYPPGAPILVPGEKITGELAALIDQSKGLITSRGKRPGMLAVLK